MSGTATMVTIVIPSASAAASVDVMNATNAQRAKKDTCKKIILEYNPNEATQAQNQEFSSCVELLYPATRTDVAGALEVVVIMLCVFIAGIVYMLHQKFK